MRKNSTLALILYPTGLVGGGAQMGRRNVGTKPEGVRIFDSAVPMNGAYDVGGAYFGLGRQLRVQYTKDLSFIRFYRVGDIDPQAEAWDAQHG